MLGGEMRLLAGFAVLALAAVVLLSFGCTALKKQCDSYACVEESLHKDCGEAIHQANLGDGRITKTEIFASATTCTMVSGLYSQDSGFKFIENTCTYQRPVNDASNSTCKYWDYRVDQ